MDVRQERPRSPAAMASQQSVSIKCDSVCLTFSSSSEAAQCGSAGLLPGVKCVGKGDNDVRCCRKRAIYTVEFLGAGG